MFSRTLLVSTKDFKEAIGHDGSLIREFWWAEIFLPWSPKVVDVGVTGTCHDWPSDTLVTLTKKLYYRRISHSIILSSFASQFLTHLTPQSEGIGPDAHTHNLMGFFWEPLGILLFTRQIKILLLSASYFGGPWSSYNCHFENLQASPNVQQDYKLLLPSIFDFCPWPAYWGLTALRSSVLYPLCSFLFCLEHRINAYL